MGASGHHVLRKLDAVREPQFSQHRNFLLMISFGPTSLPEFTPCHFLAGTVTCKYRTEDASAGCLCSPHTAARDHDSQVEVSIAYSLYLAPQNAMNLKAKAGPDYTKLEGELELKPGAAGH